MRSVCSVPRLAQQGFTLIELMIVVAIIGILSSLALPSYQNYTKKAKFVEVVISTQALKVGVEVCAQDKDGVDTCNGGTNGISNDISTAAGNVASVATAAGVITATAISSNGLSGETYVLTPTFSNGRVTWDISGTCKTVSPPIC